MKPCILCALLFALAVLAACGGEKTTLLDLVEHADTDTITDVGAPGDSVGDILTFANPVFDENNRAQVGTNSGYCLRTVAGEIWECLWTLFIAGGQLTVEGPFYDKSDSVLAIIGGTGMYRGARGQMMLHARNPAGTEFDFRYEILQ